MLSWVARFRLGQYVKGSVWIVPLLGAVIGMALGPGGTFFDRHGLVPSGFEYSPSTATAVLAAVVGAAAALAGFVVTVSVLVVQIAEGSLSARYMRLWFRDRLLKLVLAVLLGTLTFAMQELRLVGSTTVPDAGVTISELLLVVGLIVFLLFLDRALHRVRPVAVAALIGTSIRKTCDGISRESASPDSPDFVALPYESEHALWAKSRADESSSHVVTSTGSGSLQAIDGRGLVRFARAHDCRIVLLHAVGDFVSHGAPLLAVYGYDGEASGLAEPLRRMVALGNERTIDQDPAFGVRIRVDIANMALSPAVNDPTTAVQVLDHLGESLRVIGSADLAAAGKARGETHPRVIVPTQSWDEILTLAVTEIRTYGAASIQVNRRLRAMLETLEASVPAVRKPAVAEELARLDASVARAFAGSVDLDRAGVADSQGLGGRTRAAPATQPG
jgi:uncharacterized membrane protein